MSGVADRVTEHILRAPASGQRLVETILERTLRERRPCHAYLLAGPEGLGKRAYARLMAKSLNCTGSEEAQTSACGTCTHCRQIQEGIHPDFIWISPEGSSIKIAQMRAVRKEAAFSPSKGTYRVVVLEDAHRMTTEAANSILTILEEAPYHTVLLLISSNPDALVGTILSRCFRLSFRPLPRADVAGLLSSELAMEPGEARVWADISCGNPGRALALSQDEQFAFLRQQIFLVLESLPAAGDRSIHEWASQLADMGKENNALEILELFWRDLLVLSSGGLRDLINQDFYEGLHPLVRKASPSDLLEGFDNIQVARSCFAANVNRLLIWEVLLLKLQMAFRR